MVVHIPFFSSGSGILFWEPVLGYHLFRAAFTLNAEVYYLPIKNACVIFPDAVYT